MATYKSDQIANNGPRAVHGDAKDSQRAYVTVTTAAALATNDVIQLAYLPPYAVVTGVGITASQIDTGGGLTINVGDNGYGTNGQAGYVAADTQRYMSALTVGRAATGADANSSGTLNGRARFFKNISGANLLVFATVTAGATTGAPGVIQFEVTYFVEEGQSLLNQ